jgi:DNA-binding CsgD family transcriptional regulator
MLRTTCGDLRCVRPDHRVVVARKVGPQNLARTPTVRFDAMVSRGPGCWLWAGSADHLGYGQFSVGSRRMVRAHRFAWEQAYGPLPEGAELLHRCGVRRCVRPEHLELGGRASERPTPRQIDVLRAWVRHDLRHGSLKKAGAELGINYMNASNHLGNMRRRLHVTTNDEVVAWLDEHEPGWRSVATAPRGGSVP